ncbi:uncharacterized protein LOC144445093 [Glandiceps talaboti]
MPNLVLAPSEIRFLHDSIDCRFRDGRLLLNTFESLLYGRISAKDIQIIAVISANGKWWIYAGHRRLYLYKQLEELGVIGAITVWQIDAWRIKWDVVKKKLTTDNEGLDVEVRNDMNFDIKMQKIIRAWKSTMTVQRDISLRADYQPRTVSSFSVSTPSTKIEEHRLTINTSENRISKSGVYIEEDKTTQETENSGWFGKWCNIL